jgi:hypothetical protein
MLTKWYRHVVRVALTVPVSLLVLITRVVVIATHPSVVIVVVLALITCVLLLGDGRKSHVQVDGVLGFRRKSVGWGEQATGSLRARSYRCRAPASDRRN